MCVFSWCFADKIFGRLLQDVGAPLRRIKSADASISSTVDVELSTKISRQTETVRTKNGDALTWSTIGVGSILLSERKGEQFDAKNKSSSVFPPFYAKRFTLLLPHERCPPVPYALR